MYCLLYRLQTTASFKSSMFVFDYLRCNNILHSYSNRLDITILALDIMETFSLNVEILRLDFDLYVNRVTRITMKLRCYYVTMCY